MEILKTLLQIAAVVWLIISGVTTIAWIYFGSVSLGHIAMLTEVCEAELPRSQTCVLTAVVKKEN